jgi:leucyl aminopeptidase (aminopeptidase T)
MLVVLYVIVLKETLAQLAVNKCLRIRADDNVAVFFNPHFTRLAEDIAVECFKNGADVLLNAWTDRYQQAECNYLSEESLRQPSVWCKQLTVNSTAQFYLGGVYDPAIFREMSPQKLAALEEGESASHEPYAKEGKVRTLALGLGLVTPPRAKSYGFNYKAWKSMMTAASSANPDEIASKASEVIRRLQVAEKIKVSAPGRTDLEFSVKGRRLKVNDGIVDDRDMVEGAFNASIPAGFVETTILEDSANGQAVLDVPTPWAGRTIRRMKWTFQNGKVIAFDGDKNARELRKQWEIASGDKDRISTLTIGLNPNAKLGFMINELVEGAIGIGIGGNEDADGKNKRGFYFSGAIRKASLLADGNTLIDKGKLKL